MSQTQTAAQPSLLEQQAANPLVWIDSEGFVNDMGEPMEFTNHPFLMDIFLDTSKELVIRKAAQIGMSTLAIFKIAHYCRFSRVNVIYILPTVDTVREFSPVKVAPILELNHIVDKASTSVEQKRVGESHWLFKGSYKEREAIMINADILVFDEVDACNQKVLETYDSRIKHSKLKLRWYFSTPTAPNKRIDKLYKEGDQKHWFIQCGHCGEWQFLDWPDNVCYEREVFQCTKCLGEISDQDRRLGHWEPKYPGRRISSYWINGMSAPFTSAEEMIYDEKHKSKAYFLNFCLGKPYAGSDTNVTRGTIFKNVSNVIADKKDVSMGVDTGNFNYVTVGNRQGIFDLKKLDSRGLEDEGKNDIKRLIDAYDPRTVVIDALPKVELARELAEEYPYRVYVSYFKNRSEKAEINEFNDKAKIVFSDRQRSLDHLIDLLHSGGIKFCLDDSDANLEDLAQHFENLYLRTDRDRTGQEIRVWDASGNRDHWCLALDYWLMAFERNEETEKHGLKDYLEREETIATMEQEFEKPLDVKEMNRVSYMNMDWYNA